MTLEMGLLCWGRLTNEKAKLRAVAKRELLPLSRPKTSPPAILEKIWKYLSNINIEVVKLLNQKLCIKTLKLENVLLCAFQKWAHLSSSKSRCVIFGFCEGEWLFFCPNFVSNIIPCFQVPFSEVATNVRSWKSMKSVFILGWILKRWIRLKCKEERRDNLLDIYISKNKSYVSGQCGDSCWCQ